MVATLHLTVGLPGVGKTTLARRIAEDTGAVRLTPDEWMAPLFGDNDAGGKRDVLEGRFLWLARQLLAAGADVVLDFGCWSPEERFAIRAMAEDAGSRYELHQLTLEEDERRRRATRRWQQTPSETFEMTDADHDRFHALFRPPGPDELSGSLPAAPDGYQSWAAWAHERWPTSAG